MDWQVKKQVGANEWCHSPPPWQLPFHLLVGSDTCRAVCQSQAHLQARRTTNAPEEFRQKSPSPKGLLYTFNDAHIRALGGSLLPLSPPCLCPGLFPCIRQPVMDGLIKVKDNDWVLFIVFGLSGLWQKKMDYSFKTGLLGEMSHISFKHIYLVPVK